MDQKDINKILLELELGYDLVSDKFSSTRSFFWPDLEFLEKYVEKGDNILDYGCGNGRLLALLKDRPIEYKGVDISDKLIRLAKKKYSEESNNFLKVASQGTLPFPDDFFNKVFSIAVFHHFPKKYAESRAKELYRVTLPGGMVIITVWNLWRREKLKYIVKSFFDLDFKNVRIPFKDNQGNIFYRYHRVYTMSELKDIFRRAGFSIEKTIVVSKKKLVLIARK
jgi:ubiquinone/menaquinone biosynthesis C-methylase UbiE